jgi:hypothetical protein
VATNVWMLRKRIELWVPVENRPMPVIPVIRRESTLLWTDVNPCPSASSGQALRGGDSNGGFHLVGWKGSNCSSEFRRIAYNRIGSERMQKVVCVVRGQLKERGLGLEFFPTYHVPSTTYLLPASW